MASPTTGPLWTSVCKGCLPASAPPTKNSPGCTPRLNWPKPPATGAAQLQQFGTTIPCHKVVRLTGQCHREQISVTWVINIDTFRQIRQVFQHDGALHVVHHRTDAVSWENGFESRVPVVSLGVNRIGMENSNEQSRFMAWAQAFVRALETIAPFPER